MDNFKVTKSTNEKRRTLAFLVALLILETGSFKEEALAIDQRNRTSAQNNTNSISRVSKTRTERNVVEIDGKDTVLKASATGKDVLDISTPNASGISHNKFKELSIGRDEGIIFNNSTVNGKSVIGGGVLRNLNLEKSAKVILNEVTGNTPSSINGAVEVFGDKADFILANENGIVVNNGKFINTAGVTLTTGKVSINDSKFDFNIQKGGITLNGVKSDGDYFDVYAKTIELQKEISLEEKGKNPDITIITGENTLQVDSNDFGKVSVLSGKNPPIEKHGVSGTEFGAMHGQNIKLISTDLGLGVKHEGLIFSTKDMKIDSDGNIVLNRMITSNRENNTIKIANSDTVLKKSAGGVDVVYIKTPDRNRISHNKFLDLSVGTGNGIIFNNSTKDGKSVIGGNILANSHLNGINARAILNEVTGKVPSNINGIVEVFGDKADFILANENGIMVNNGKFINTAGITLTTGKVSPSKSKINFGIQKGEILLDNIESNGSYFNTFAEAIEIQKTISAGEKEKKADINIIAGINRLKVDNNNLEKVNIVSSKENQGSEYSIYGTCLGTIYGNNIKLISTDLGILHEGSIFSTENIEINSNEDVILRNVKSQGNIKISGQNIVLRNNRQNPSKKGSISSDKDISVEANYTIINDGIISGNGNINISGEIIFNGENSSILAEKDLKLIAQEKISNEIGSSLEAKGKAKLNSKETRGWKGTIKKVKNFVLMENKNSSRG